MGDPVQGDVKGLLGLTALLVRPDGIVAWACEGEANAEEAVEAGSLWFAVRDGG
ncbi:hypothetical protein CUJ84_Chr000645 [Rhizobium leguminosarum]|uniref:Uncharacterized protein n=1 Tax=Rhizobium leguminosarum TaxID=384 RepID=A0A2K9YYI7_RHILE|nr:hypothetical protein CUJ84_Chr000645 [Rhizobium leguminosarum]